VDVGWAEPAFAGEAQRDARQCWASAMKPASSRPARTAFARHSGIAQFCRLGLRTAKPNKNPLGFAKSAHPNLRATRCISIGALTKHVRAIDLSMRFDSD